MFPNVQESKSGVIVRTIVIAIGLVLFVLLFLADKTHLATKAKPSVQGTSSSAQSDSRPALSPEANTDEWIEKAKNLTGKEKLVAIDSVISKLSTRNRYDVAFDYAAQKAEIENSLENQLLAGTLGAKALSLDFVAKDSLTRSQFVSKATKFLEAVIEKDSTNEAALMALGTTYILSGRQENSMKGILNIRKVTEINPQNVKAQYMLGEFSIQTGQYEKAEARFRKVLQIEPNNERAKLQLASVLQSLGKQAEAQKVATELQSSSNDSIKAIATQLLNQK